MTSKLLATAFAGLALFALQTNSAHAVPVTFNPSAVGLGTAPNAFTSDSLGLLDYATTTLTGTTSTGGATFTETGFLNLTAFNYNGASISPPGLASGGSGSYSLYLSFTAEGSQSSSNLGAGGGIINGSFSKLSFSLIGGNGLATFAQTDTGFVESGTTNEVTLATGNLLTPSNNFTTYFNDGTGITASASNVKTTFTPTDAGAAFFTSPTPFALNLSAAFTNNSGNVSLLPSGQGFRITAGGGDAMFIPAATSVPEPMTLTLLGTGLVAVGALRRRRK